MSLRPDGVYRCDGCGWDVQNAGVDKCSIISDLDPRTNYGTMRVLHFCRDHEVDGIMVEGCTDKVLTDEALSNYLENR